MDSLFFFTFHKDGGKVQKFQVFKNGLKFPESFKESFTKRHKVSQSFNQQINIQKLLKISSKIKIRTTSSTKPEHTTLDLL